MRNLKTATWQEAKLSKDSDGNFSFLVADFFFHLKKYTKCVFFQKWTKKILQLKKQNKKTSESLENCTTSNAVFLNAHFLLLFKNQNEKMKKARKVKKKYWKTLLHVRHQVWHQFGGPWVRGVHWHPLRPHLTPGCPLTPLNLLNWGAHQNPLI